MHENVLFCQLQKGRKAGDYISVKLINFRGVIMAVCVDGYAAIAGKRKWLLAHVKN